MPAVNQFGGMFAGFPAGYPSSQYSGFQQPSTRHPIVPSSHQFGSRPAKPASSGLTPEPAVSVPPHAPPLHEYGRPEPAIKHVYNHRTKQWNRTEITVALHPTCFEEGNLRSIYHMRDFSLKGEEQFVVSKVSKDANEPKNSYFMDVEMQGLAKAMSEQFNSRQPPKPITFVMPWVVELKHRCGRNGQGRLYMGCEHFLKGTYEKHSNNWGYVAKEKTGEDRNTPAAFSHFTHHQSNGAFIVVDIQGVEDAYTDPQVHSCEKAHTWGKADMGPEGIRQFFKSHKCNAICEYLNLPVTGKKKDIGLAKAMGDEDAAAAARDSVRQIDQKQQSTAPGSNGPSASGTANSNSSNESSNAPSCGSEES